MKPKLFLFFCLLLPAITFGQSIKSPLVSSSDDPSTVITEIETNSKNTVVSFKHICHEKGSWVQLNKSMYLQDANGEDTYKYIKSEGLPLRPAVFTATQDNQEVNFKVYFEKLKPGTKEINVIERARSLAELGDGITYFNYYRVSLTNSRPVMANGDQMRSVTVTMTPPPPIETDRVVTDTAYAVGSDFGSSAVNIQMANFGPVMTSMYANVLNMQLKMYSDPAITTQLAQITKNYYDALLKVGFPPDAALKIITSKQLISMDGGSK